MEPGIGGLNRGTLISGAGHLVLVIGLVVGDWLEDWMNFTTPTPEVADVTLVSEAEYAGLVLPRVQTPGLPEVPDFTAPPPGDAPVSTPASTEVPGRVETPEALVPEEAGRAPDALEEPEVSTPFPPEPVDGPAMDVALPEPQPLVSSDVESSGEIPKPQDAPRIAPVPVLESPPAPEFAETSVPEVSADSESPDVELELPVAAPPEATTEIVTEAETPSFAPAASTIPRPRPARTAASEPEPEPAPEPAPEPELASGGEMEQDRPSIDLTAVERAVEAAIDGADPDAAPSGIAASALSQDEIEGLRVAVRRCWNVGALSMEALAVTVTVGISMNRDGKPDEPRLLGHTGGSEAAARKAFDVARRAILRCGGNGYDLPADRYEHWREIEITFNPEKMRLK